MLDNINHALDALDSINDVRAYESTHDDRDIHVVVRDERVIGEFFKTLRQNGIEETDLSSERTWGTEAPLSGWISL